MLFITTHPRVYMLSRMKIQIWRKKNYEYTNICCRGEQAALRRHEKNSENILENGCWQEVDNLLRYKTLRR